MSGTNTPEYKTFFRNQAKIADAISDVNGLNDRIVAELYSMKIVGKAVRDAADIRGPQVTEIQRVRPVLNAIVTRIKVDKNMYYKVRDVLLSDTISVDAPELALYLPEVPLAEDEGGSHRGTGAGSQPAMAGGYTQPSPYQTQPTQPGYAPQSYQHPSQVPVGPSYAHQPLYSQPGLPPQQGVLTAQDLHILTSIMKAAAPQWQAIGGALGFLYSDLTIIQNTPMLIPQAPQSYFREMLSQWLNWAPPNHPWPTLEALDMALRRSGQENLAFQLRSLFLQQKGYVPQYSQNPNQFPAGPTHQPVYSHPGYPPTGSQYPPQQGYYYGQPAPSTQLPPVGTEVPPHQYTGAAMQGPSYQEPQFNHHTWHCGGICFLGDPWQETVTSAGKEISWADIGIKIIIPPGAIPEEKPITVAVRPCLSGPFELPEDYELASPVYAISPGLEFIKDVKLFMAHFADLQCEDDCKNMTFLTTESSSLPGDSHSYRLLTQKNGVFQMGSKEGEISLKHFCKKAIGRKCKQAGNKPRGSRGVSRNKKQKPKLDSKDKQGNVEQNKGNQNRYAAALYQNEGGYHFKNTAAVTVTLNQPVYILNFTKCLESWYPPPFRFVPSETSVNFSGCKAIVEIPTYDETEGWKIIPDIQPCEISKEAVDLPISKPDADYAIARTYPPKILLTISPPADKIDFRFCQLPISGFTKEVKFTLQLNPSLHMVTPLTQLNRHGLLPSITDCETEHLSFSDTPVLTKLLKFPGRYGKINIPERIGTNYKTFGTFLLKDDTGAIVSGIVQAKMHAADEINEAILERWIGGKGQGPFTWGTLVKCLRDTELNVLANEIEEVLQ